MYTPCRSRGKADLSNCVSKDMYLSGMVPSRSGKAGLRPPFYRRGPEATAGVGAVVPVGFRPSILVCSTSCLFTFAHKQQQIKVGRLCALVGDLIPSTGSLVGPLYPRQR